MIGVAWLALPAATRGGSTFTNIIDSTSPYTDFAGPSLNNNGVVAFYAQIKSGGYGIFSSNGSTTTTIADTTGSSFGNVYGTPSINDSGFVAFTGAGTAGAGIFAGAGGAVTPIAVPGSMFAGLPVGFGGTTSINNSGVAGFEGDLTAGGSGVFAGNGTTTTTIALTGSTFRGFGSYPSINQSGIVAFEAGLVPVGAGIFTGNGGAIKTIADTSGNIAQPYNPSINDSGTVAFKAGLTSGDFAILAGNGGPLQTVASTADGKFSNFADPSINKSGDIAFFANLVSGGSGIYIGPDPAVDKVIATGDPLFGSTVTDLYFWRTGLNDQDQLAFYYSLSDGVQGLAVANLSSVPEPSTLTLAAIGIAGFVLWTRGRRAHTRPSKPSSQPDRSAFGKTIS